MASLEVISGPGAGRAVPLTGGTVVVGRGESCPLMLPDIKLSREHLRVHFDEDRGQWIAYDLKSVTGTRVNGRELLGEMALHDSDEIVLGETRMVFRERDRATC